MKQTFCQVNKAIAVLAAALLLAVSGMALFAVGLWLTRRNRHE